MEWLTPITAAYAAAVCVPLLLLLYFLKLKRRELLISSTLLWKRAVQDLQVNAPFQRLRRNILLLLQLLALLAIVLGLGGPMLFLDRGPVRRYVILIDRSASMSATDVKPTRLEQAKRQAKQFVRSLFDRTAFSFGSRPDQVMVVAFDRHAKVMCNFTSEVQQLFAAIDAIQPGDGPSLLHEAILVGQAFAVSDDSRMSSRGAEGSAKLVLFSDGQIQDLDRIIAGAGELVFHCIGHSGANVAITAMNARRSYENPEQVQVFGSVANYADEPVSCDVHLSLNGDVVAVKTVTIPPCETVRGSRHMRPGVVAVDFVLNCPQRAIIELRHGYEDPFAADDAAWAVVGEPSALSVLLVTGGNFVLESALRSCPVAEVIVRDPNDSAVGELLQAGRYDVIVLDNCGLSELPRGRYIVFGRPPGGIEGSVLGQIEDQVVVDWRTKHPVLRYVDLVDVYVTKAYKVSLPADAEVLAEFNESPALALVRRAGSVVLWVGFDVLQSNWPFEPGFVLFCYNALRFVGSQLGGELEANLQVGDPIVLEGLSPGTTAVVDGPHISNVALEASSGSVIRFAGTDRVGVYRLRMSGRPERCYVVNLLDAQESDVRPRRQIELSGELVQAQSASAARANVPLWSYLVGIALLVVLIEWVVYNRKVRI